MIHSILPLFYLPIRLFTSSSSPINSILLLLFLLIQLSSSSSSSSTHPQSQIHAFQQPSTDTCPIPPPSTSSSSESLPSSSSYIDQFKPSNPSSPSPDHHAHPPSNQQVVQPALPKLLSFSEWKAKDRSIQNSRRTNKKLDPPRNPLQASDSHPPHPHPSPASVASTTESPPNLNHTPPYPTFDSIQPPHLNVETSSSLNPTQPIPPSWSKVSSALLHTISEGHKLANGLIRSSHNPPSSFLMNCQSPHDRSSSSDSPSSNSLHNLSIDPHSHHPIHPNSQAFHISPPPPSSFHHHSSHPIYYPDSNTGSGNSLDPLNTLSTRTNYASFDCSASIHRSSKHTKSSSAILNEKKDKYMLMPCINKLSNNFVVFELCDEIEIDSVVLANFEFFSSMFKLIKMSVSNSGLEGAAGADWVHVGFLKTQNTRGLQVFPIKHLKGFYRYVRLDFLTHYGTEYYCPLSLVRIYGLTQIDAYRRDEKLRQIHHVEDGVDDHDDEDVASDYDVNLITSSRSDHHQDPNLGHSDSKLNGSDRMTPDLNQVHHPLDPSNLVSPQASPKPSSLEQTSSSSLPQAESSSDAMNEKVEQDLDELRHSSTDPVPQSTSDSTIPAKELSHSDSKTPPEDESSHHPSTQPDSPQDPPSLTPQPASHSAGSSAPNQAPAPDFYPPSPSLSKSVQPDEPVSAHSEQQPLADRLDRTDQPPQSHSSIDLNHNNSTISISAYNSTNHTTSAPWEGKKVAVNPETPKVLPNPKPIYPEKSYPPTASSTGQSSESIFGQIMKRLNNLESNHDLTLKYVEDQVKILESSIHRLDERLVELEKIFKHQAAKSRKMMNEFNSIKSKFSLERSFLNHQIESLDASITFIKRFGLVQFISILAILVFLCLTRFQHTPTTSSSTSSEPGPRGSRKNSSQIAKLRTVDPHSLGLGRVGRKNSTVFMTRTPGGSSSSRNSFIGRRRCRPRFSSPSNEIDQAVIPRNRRPIVRSACGGEDHEDWLMSDHDAAEERANDESIDPVLRDQDVIVRDARHGVLNDPDRLKFEPTKGVEIPLTKVERLSPQHTHHNDVHRPACCLITQADQHRLGLLPPSYRSTVSRSPSSPGLLLPITPSPSPPPSTSATTTGRAGAAVSVASTRT